MFKPASINTPCSRNMNSRVSVSAAIENPVTGETKWTDVSVTHTSAASYADADLKAVGHQINSSNIAVTFESQIRELNIFVHYV